MLGLKRKKWVAIDYDRREVRLVVFERARRQPEIVSLHTAAIPPDVDAADAAALGAFLKPVVEKLHLRGARAVMCVERANAVLKSLTLPPSEQTGDLAAMVQYQVSKDLPFSAEEAVVDYTRGAHWDTDQQEAPEGTMVLAAAVRLPVVDAGRIVCTTAGLRLQRLGLRPCANLRAVYRCVRAAGGQRLLLVNVTADEAEIDVMRDGMLEFSRAATLALSGDAAGGPPDSTTRAETVARIVSEVTRSLHSFHAVQRGARLDGCLLAGATGLERDLADALTRRLGVECRLLDLTRGFAVRRQEAVSAFAAALGLAADTAAEAPPFDFLNPKRPAVPADRRRVRGLAIAAAAVFVLALGVLLTRMHLADRRRGLDQLRDRHADLKTANKDLKAIRKRVIDLRGWLDEETDWLEQIARLSRTLPEAREIYLSSLDCGPGPARRRGGTRPGRIALVGRVRNSRTVGRFEEKLADRPGYTVSHKGTSPAPGDAYGVNFSVDVLISGRARATTRPARPPAGARTRRAP